MAKRGKVIRFPQTPRTSRRPLPGRQSAGWTAEQRFVEIHRCRDQSEALVLRGLFDSEGIPCLLRSRLVHSLHPFSVGDQGEVIVLVPGADAPQARLLLARISPRPSFP